jgi:hypothetical protein
MSYQSCRLQLILGKSVAVPSSHLPENDIFLSVALLPHAEQKSNKQRILRKPAFSSQVALG